MSWQYQFLCISPALTVDVSERNSIILFYRFYTAEKAHTIWRESERMKLATFFPSEIIIIFFLPEWKKSLILQKGATYTSTNTSVVIYIGFLFFFALSGYQLPKQNCNFPFSQPSLATSSVVIGWFCLACQEFFFSKILAIFQLLTWKN